MCNSAIGASSDDDSQEAVEARLKIVRKIIGLSKRDFAEKAGLSEQVFGPFENGKRALTLSAAKMLRKTYGLPLEFLYFGRTDDLPTRISKFLGAINSVFETASDQSAKFFI